MKILLPPSEGKTPPASGPSLELRSLAFAAELTGIRQRVADELIEVSRSEEALAILGVGERTREEVENQRGLFELPCTPAHELYTGVLYEAAKLTERDDVWIFSGLFGLTAGSDMIPAYRLSMGVNLPRLGSLKALWKAQLKALQLTEETVIDMRSGAYQVWNPPGSWWDVRVVDSRGKVISHMAKHHRGLLTRLLLDSGSEDVAEVARALGKVSVEEKKNRRHLTIQV